MLSAVARLAVPLLALIASATSGVSGARDRRIVDTVEAGDAVSEANHGYVGTDARTDVINGQTVRRTLGTMRYAMHTFDDTPLTVACTFLDTDSATYKYDLVVEDSLIMTRTITTSPTKPTVVDMAVPFAVTKGRTNVAIVIRARDGQTPALRTMRTVQDHNEEHEQQQQ